MNEIMKNNDFEITSFTEIEDIISNIDKVDITKIGKVLRGHEIKKFNDFMSTIKGEFKNGGIVDFKTIKSSISLFLVDIQRERKREENEINTWANVDNVLSR